MLYMFQAVPPTIIRSKQLYIQLQILYLKLYVQLCAPDDGRKNGLKHVEHL